MATIKQIKLAVWISFEMQFHLYIDRYMSRTSVTQVRENLHKS